VDVAWNCWEDEAENDTRMMYAIACVGPTGAWPVVIWDWDILRFVRPSNVCKVTFDLTTPEGAPDRARDIEISSEYNGAGFYRRIVTNYHGHAAAFLKHGERLLLRIDGRPTALDFCVPELNIVSSEKLREFGSEIMSDQRGFL
jgi:hypothetical protein